MDKVLIGILVFVLIVAATIGVITWLNNNNLDEMLNYVDQFKRETSLDNVPTRDENGNWCFVTDEDFKILHLTDVHIGGGIWSTETDKKAVNAVAAMVEAEDPDLVVVTGDISFAYVLPWSGTFNNKHAHDIFIRLMENLGVSWTITLGNHDTEPYNFYNRKEVANMYADESLERCLFTHSPENVSGEGNHIINIKNSAGEVTQTLFMMDSHSYIRQDFFGGIIDSIFWNYDNIKQDQVDWYANVIAEYNPQTSLVFFHIPLAEVKEGYEEYIANGREYTENVTGFEGNDGETGDVVYSSGLGDNLFEKIIELGNTKYVFNGHDHFNNFVMEYKGVKFSYGYSIDYMAYGDIGSKGYQRGCTVIVLDVENPSDVTVTHENYYQEKYQSLDEMKEVDMDPNANK